MEYILASLEMFAGVSENLINYTFNVSSFMVSFRLDAAYRQVPADISPAIASWNGRLPYMHGPIFWCANGEGVVQAISSTYRASISTYPCA